MGLIASRKILGVFEQAKFRNLPIGKHTYTQLINALVWHGRLDLARKVVVFVFNTVSVRLLVFFLLLAVYRISFSLLCFFVSSSMRPSLCQTLAQTQ